MDAGPIGPALWPGRIRPGTRNGCAGPPAGGRAGIGPPGGMVPPMGGTVSPGGNGASDRRRGITEWRRRSAARYRPARRRGGGWQGPAGPCGDAKAPLHAVRRSPDGCGRADRLCPSRGGLVLRRRIRRRVSGGNGRLDWWVASLPATRGIECGTGEPSSVYMAERRAPGRGFEPPRLSHLAVFKTAAFPLCQPGAGGADCRRWTGLSGMRVQRAGVQRVSVIRRLRRQDGGGGGGGRSGIPNGMPQGTPMNALAYRRPIGRRHSGAANRRRPGMGAGFWGRRWASLAFRPIGRHGMWCRLLAARGMVPAIAGPVCGAAWYGAALLGGTVCGAADRRHGSAGRSAGDPEPPANSPAAKAGGGARFRPGNRRAGGLSGRNGAAYRRHGVWAGWVASGPAMAGPACFREREAGGGRGLGGRRRGTAGAGEWRRGKRGRTAGTGEWRKGTIGTGE